MYTYMWLNFSGAYVVQSCSVASTSQAAAGTLSRSHQIDLER